MSEITSVSDAIRHYTRQFGLPVLACGHPGESLIEKGGNIVCSYCSSDETAKAAARERLEGIVQTLGDGDCGRFYSLEQCEVMAAEGREICARWGFDVPWRIELPEKGGAR